jgi:acetylglutamate kinase
VKVIKLGGSLLDDAQTRVSVLQGVVAQWNAGHDIVLVHGGGKHIDAMMAKLGLPKRTHAGLRITDDATLDIVVSVLGGMVNKLIVGELTALGVKSAGLSGADAGTLVAEQHPPIDGVDLGHVGRVVASNPTLVKSMLTYGILPVVSSIAMSKEGQLFNVNADSAASALAAALKARSLQFITDVEGLMDANGNVVEALNADDAHALISTGVVRGGMLPKLSAALNAMNAGVASVTIGCSVVGLSGVSVPAQQLNNPATQQPGTIDASS